MIEACAPLPAGPLVAWYGDDFTGAAAVLELLETAGLPAVLFMDIPDRLALARFPQARGIGIAGTARTWSPGAMAKRLPQAFAALADTGAPLLHYKSCSTMDSSPVTGSIGKAIEIGLELRPGWAPLMPAAPPIGRYQAFANLFAVVDGHAVRLDRDPTMRNHPVTPMDEADVRRHVARQTALPIGLVDIVALAQDGADVALDEARSRGAAIVAIDMIDEDSLAAAGALLWDRKSEISIAAGSQGVEYALIAHWRRCGLIDAMPKTVRAGAVERIAAVSGSCSPLTAEQIDWAGQNGFHLIQIDVTHAIDARSWRDAVQRAIVQATVAAAQGEDPLIFTARGPGDPAIAALNAAIGTAGADPAEVNAIIGRGLGAILEGVMAYSGIRRVAVAGGDTSGFACETLRIVALSLAGSLSPAVAVFAAHGADSTSTFEISLKGGQMGTPDYFGRVKHGASFQERIN